MTDNVKQLPGGGPKPWANRVCPTMSRPVKSSIVDASGQQPGLDVVACLGPACAMWVDIKTAGGDTVFSGCGYAAPAFLAVQQLAATGALIQNVAQIANIATARIHIEHPETKEPING